MPGFKAIYLSASLTYGLTLVYVRTYQAPFILLLFVLDSITIYSLDIKISCRIPSLKLHDYLMTAGLPRSLIGSDLEAKPG